MDLHPIYPDVLMTTHAVESNIGNLEYRLFEVNLDPEAYAEGHVPGAIHLDWKRQLHNTQTFDILTPEELAELLGQCGVEPHHKIVLYGDNNNWFACWAYWLLSMAGHKQVWLMDGGRKKWFEEEREVTTVAPRIERAEYPFLEFDSDSRASIEHVFEAISALEHTA